MLAIWVKQKVKYPGVKNIVVLWNGCCTIPAIKCCYEIQMPSLRAFLIHIYHRTFAVLTFSFQCPSQQHKNLLRTKQSTERSRGQGRDEDRKTCPLGRGQVRREVIPPASASPGSRSNTHSFPSDLSVTIKFPLTSGQLSPSTYIPGPFFPALALLSLH